MNHSNKAVTGTWAYTATDYIFVPDTKLSTVPAEARLEPLRGYSYTVAVMIGDTCIGWTMPL